MTEHRHEHRARIGVIGAGWWSSVAHLPALAAYDAADLYAIADSDATKLRRAADRFDVPRTYTDYRALLEDDDLDAVVAALPHHLHYPVVRDAVSAGKHVFIEKPFTLHAWEAWDLVAAAERAGVHIAVGYTHQYTGTARATKRQVEEGMLGDLKLITLDYATGGAEVFRGEFAPTGDSVEAPEPTTYTDPSVGGGNLLTNVTHGLAMLLHISGERVIEVAAFLDSEDAAVDLTESISFRTGGGALGTIAATCLLKAGQPSAARLHYYGTNGTVVQDLVAGEVVLHPAGGEPERLPVLAPEERAPADLPAKVFVDLVLGRGENPAPAEAAARTVECIEAALLSNRLRRRVPIEELPLP